MTSTNNDDAQAAVAEPTPDEAAAEPVAEVVAEPVAELVVPGDVSRQDAPAPPVSSVAIPNVPGRIVLEPKGMIELPRWGLWAIIVVAAIYLGNFTMGVDVLPDNLPIIGNMDEVAAFFVGQQAWAAIQYGISYLFKLKDTAGDGESQGG